VIWLLSKIDAPGPGQPGALWQGFLIVAMLTVTVLLSMASYAFLEAPFLRLKDRYFAREGRGVRDMPVAITASA
jgi:peptidoglycan/LPS O-acetylase OafA/YrhL